MSHKLIGILIILFVMMVMGPVVRAEESNSVPPDGIYSTFTFKDLGEKDIVVKTIFDQMKVTFPLAEGRKIHRAMLRLSLSHSQKLLPELSDLTIVLNNEPVASFILTPENAAANFIDFPLPVAAFQPGPNHLIFQLNQRLQSQGCQDINDPALWTQIGADTRIELYSIDVPIVPALERFPAPFDTLTTLAKSPHIYMILPSEPTSVELTVAGQIATALGQAARWETPPLHALTVDQLEREQVAGHHLIVIDTGQRNTLAKGVEAGLTEQVSPYNPNRSMLVVSAPDEVSLQQVAEMLVTKSARANLRGAHVPPIPITSQPSPPKPTRVSFAELGFEDLRVRGIGPHDLYYPIDIPYDWKITSEASIEIDFSHARSLDEAKSLLSIFVNGFKVSEVPLTDRNAADGRMTVQISPQQIRPGRNWLHLLFDLHAKDQDCDFRYLQEAWAGVSTTGSIMNLAHVESEPPLSIRDFPSLLLTPTDLSKDIFILPDTPTQVELTALVKLAAKLGTYTMADPVRPQVITAAEFNPSLATANHIVAIGHPGANSFLATYNSQFLESLRRAGNNTEISTIDQNGYIQILPAPWSQQASLMILSAVDDRLMTRVVDVLPTLGHRLKVKGRIAIVTLDQVKGLNTGVPVLEQVARETLSVILFGTFVTIGSVGWLVHRHQSRKPEFEDENG